MSKKGIGSHQSAAAITTTWISPRDLVKKLGRFDLDPCAAINQPWYHADRSYTILDDGLKQDWEGRVWLNPPYGDEMEPWLIKGADHGNTMAIVFARTETNTFFNGVWDRADGLLFIRQRITFYHEDGTKAKANGGAPSVLIAYGQNNAECLEALPLPGKFIPLNYHRIIVVGISPSWISVVSIAVRNFGDQELKPIYDMVERIAPDKVAKNQFWKEKVRQKVQQCRKSKLPVL